MRPTRSIAMIVICLLFLNADAWAQQQHRHEGFWIGFGIGGGANLSTGLDDERRGGGAGYLRLGGNLSQQFLIGGELLIWGRRDDTIIGSNSLGTIRSNVTVTVLFYPDEAGRFFIKGGLGGAAVEYEIAGVEIGETGGAATLGLGYDIRLGRNIFLTPNIDWMMQTFEDASGDRATNSLVLLTVGLTWH